MKFQLHLACCGFGFVAAHLEKCRRFAYSLAPSLSKFREADRQGLNSVYKHKINYLLLPKGLTVLDSLLITKKERLI